MRINNSSKIDSITKMLNKYFADGKQMPIDELKKWVDEDIIYIAFDERFIDEIDSNMCVITRKGEEYIGI